MLGLRSLSGVACHCAGSPAAFGSRRMIQQTAAPRHSGGMLHSNATVNGATPQPSASRSMAALVASAATTSSALTGSTAAGAAGAALAALLDPTAALQSDATAAARIFPNENADAAPWEASCIELGTEAVEQDDTSTSFGVTVKGGSVDGAATRPTPAVTQTVVRLYFETARREGLYSFRSVAQRVALGELPGRTENRMSVGYAVWIVPRDDYIAMLAQRPQISAPARA